MRRNNAITRREFIRRSTLVAAGSAVWLMKADGAGGVNRAASGNGGQSAVSRAATRTKVVLVRNRDVLDVEGRPRTEVVSEMLDAALKELTGESGASAWKTLIKPDDIVGIKTNVWNFLPTTRQVEEALKKGVLAAGVKEENIGIDDRGVLRHPVFQKTTALINARPIRSHHWSGVGSLIKNYIMFVPDPFNYHDDSCARLATIWDNPLVRGKTRLNVLVMLTPQFHGVGPHNFNPAYVWSYHGLIVGFDPVACDATGLRIIEAKRREFFAEDRPLSPPAKHISLADTRYGLGTADPDRIDIIKIGETQDILI